MEEVGFMSHTATSHQVAIKTLWLHFIYSLWWKVKKNNTLTFTVQELIDWHWFHILAQPSPVEIRRPDVNSSSKIYSAKYNKTLKLLWNWLWYLGFTCREKTTDKPYLMSAVLQVSPIANQFFFTIKIVHPINSAAASRCCFLEAQSNNPVLLLQRCLFWKLWSK